ncbi:tyrosine-type recombinase/integrase [Actinomadura sp. K4S16]|uniref:tyrosine-type recombinase/integrase n=1 Tax=Actinomadura sp. K4S16 TaxID=1316147 RepID=UPI0011EC8844
MIALDRTTIAALRVHRSRQQAEVAAYGEGYRDSGYAFTNLNGDPVAPGRLTHVFQKLIAEHDVPQIRLHDLRHGAATLALAAGVQLKVGQEMLGHSSIVLTADTYTSVLPEVAHTAAKKTAAYLLHAAGWCLAPPSAGPCSGSPSTAGGEPYPGGPGAAPVDRPAPRTGVVAATRGACLPCHRLRPVRRQGGAAPDLDGHMDDEPDGGTDHHRRGGGADGPDQAGGSGRRLRRARRGGG